MDITVEDKLRLLQKLKDDAASNQDAMQVRREILSNEKGSYGTIDDVGGNGFLSLKVRTFFALLLFLGYLLMQYGDITIGTISDAEIETIISKTQEIKLFDFQLRLPYTLEE